MKNIFAVVVLFYLTGWPAKVQCQDYEHCDFKAEIEYLKDQLKQVGSASNLLYKLTAAYIQISEIDSAKFYLENAFQVAPADSLKDYYALRFSSILNLDSLSENLLMQYDSSHVYISLLKLKLAQKAIGENEFDKANALIKDIPGNLSQSLSFKKEYFEALGVKSICLGKDNKFSESIQIARAVLDSFEVYYSVCDKSYLQLLISMANRYDDAEKMDSSLDYLERGLHLLNEYYTADDPMRAVFENKLGEYYKLHGNSNKSIYHFERAVDIALEKKTEYRKLLGTIYNNLGSIYLHNDHPSKTKHYFNKAIILLKEEYGDNSPQLVGPYLNFGVALMSVKEYEFASLYFDKALAYSLELVGEDHLYTAVITGSMASNEHGRLDYDRSEDYFLRSLQIRKKLYGESSIRVGFLYINMSILYRDMGLYNKANIFLNKALKIYENNYGPDHKDLRKVYNRLGINYYHLAKYDQAIEAFEKGLDIPGIGTEQHLSFDPLNHLALLKNRGFTRLEQYLDTEQKSLLDFAHNDFLEAKKIFDFQFTKSSKTEDIVDLVGGYGDIFSLGISTYLQKYHKDHSDLGLIRDAWDLVDLTKSVGLRQELKTMKEVANLDDPTISKLSELNRLRYTYITNGKTAELNGELTKLSDSIIWVESLIDSIEQKIKIDNPNYYHALLNNESIPWDILIKSIPSNTTMVDYYLSDSSLFVFYLASDSFSVNQFDIGKDFHKALEDGRSSFIKGDDGSYGIVNELLAKTIEHIPSHSKVVIIPDPSLASIPFEALVTSKEELVLEDYVISYAQSLSIYLHQISSQQIQTKKMFAGFAPNYQLNNMDTLKRPLFANLVREGNYALPFAKEEVSQIKNNIGGTAYFGLKANKSRFLQALDNTSIVHLSLHAIMDKKNPLNSRLLFNDSNGGIDELHLYELFGEMPKSSLVVLSACNTGIGRADKTGSLSSFGNTMAHLGIPASIISLWQVPDESTSKIMVEFYNQLKMGKSKDEALRQAKLIYLAETVNPIEKAPFYWAGFIAIGNMESMHLKSEYSKYYWVGLVLILLTILFFLWNKRKSIVKPI